MGSGQEVNFMYRNKYPLLGEGSNEWIQLEYDLELGLGSISAVVKEIKAVNNQSLQFQFEKHNTNKLILESWIDYNRLNEYAPVEDICYKGFEFKDNNGYVFPTGYIDLSEPKENKNGKEFTILMFKVAVGRSQCIPSCEEDYRKKPSQLEGNFDSIYLYDEQDKQGGVFLHKYVIFKKEQILPMYLIKFEFDDKKELQLQPAQCQNCESNLAKVYCYNDDANFCNECSFEIHQSNQVSFQHRHKLVEISKKEKSFGLCPAHPEAKLELYCVNCHQALCVYCKIQQQGSHSQGEPAGHTIVKIAEAYKKAIHESKVLDPLLEKRKNELSDMLNQIDQKIKDVNQKASQIEEKIYKLLQDGLELLQEKTKEKMCVLIGDQLELKRQYDQIQWMEQFLKYQQNVLNPSDYLKAWSRHSALRNKIVSQGEKSIMNDISPEFGFEATPIKITNDVGGQNLPHLGSDFKQDNSYSGIKGSSSQFRSNILSQKNAQMKSGDKNSGMANFIVTKDKNSAKKAPELIQTTGIIGMQGMNPGAIGGPQNTGFSNTRPFQGNNPDE